VFPAPLMSTSANSASFLARESQAAGVLPDAALAANGSTDGELAAS
jgi:hypothetical protein